MSYFGHKKAGTPEGAPQIAHRPNNGEDTEETGDGFHVYVAEIGVIWGHDKAGKHGGNAGNGEHDVLTHELPQGRTPSTSS